MEDLSHLSPANLEYLEDQYHKFKLNPQSVDAQWRHFFEIASLGEVLPNIGRGVGEEAANGSLQLTPHSTSLASAASASSALVLDSTSTSLGSMPASPASSAPSASVLDEHEKYMMFRLVEHYRDYGHLKAHLNPLAPTPLEEESFNFSEINIQHLEQHSDNSSNLGVLSVDHLMQTQGGSLEDVARSLREKYSGTLAIHVAGCEPLVRSWFLNEMEMDSSSFQLSAEEKLFIFHSLAKTEALEQFIHARYVGTKRFSIEGGDALLPMLEHSVTIGTCLGVEELVLGMAHRGRINVLANFMDKALNMIFADFDGIVIDDTGYDGDVKYHMGYSSDKKTPHGDCHISLAFNPSHLECVTPVVCGMVRAKQRRRQDTQERKKVVPILIHGDAAFSGQGVISETLQISQLDGYRVGGSVHVIVNNQVGFTTDSKDGRSTRYSSDVAKSINAPVILVNGDDVLACVRAMDMAIRFRQKFRQDVVIDMICYRRFGHNEGDEPMFTQPQMYSKIKKHPTLKTIYTRELVRQSILTEEEAKLYYKERINSLQKILDDTRENPPEIQPLAFAKLWSGLRRSCPEDFETIAHTKYPKEKLLKVSEVLTQEPPSSFTINSKLKRLIKNRKKMMEQGVVDWGMGELLAYASLREEGTPIRISGQDCKRGTFSHRHAVYFDQKTGEEYCPLSTLNLDQGEFCIYNSSLSEIAVLGFEYGNAVVDPMFLSIWEAQFGDFANGAQIIIDQFISSGEQKWTRYNGLTLLLPHGYEGQGPEHSSAKLERFLQLCGQDNMQVCNLTTPSNLFHALRRQTIREIRKPLVIMSPKSLLRHPKVVSPLSEFSEGHFQEVIEDNTVHPSNVESLFFCSGKIYYEIQEAREAHGADFARKAVVRVEQFYPFPKVQLAPIISRFTNLKKVLWVQEEPQNMGASMFMAPRLRDLLGSVGFHEVEVGYLGRTERASPATGSPKVHRTEQQDIIDACIQL